MKKSAVALIAAVALIGTAHATDNPPVKEGFWTVHTITLDNPGNKTSTGTYAMCRSHAFDAYLEAMKKVPAASSKPIPSRARTTTSRCPATSPELP